MQGPVGALGSMTCSPGVSVTTSGHSAGMMVMQLPEVLEERWTPQLPDRKRLGKGHASPHCLAALNVTLHPLLGRV